MALMHLDVTNGMGSIPAGSPTQIGRVRKSSEVTLTNFRPLAATGPCGSCMPGNSLLPLWSGPVHAGYGVRTVPHHSMCAVYRAACRARYTAHSCHSCPTDTTFTGNRRAIRSHQRMHNFIGPRSRNPRRSGDTCHRS
jgi:hypothetical protein